MIAGKGTPKKMMFLMIDLAVELKKKTSTMFFSCEYATNLANIFTRIIYLKQNLYSKSLDSKVF